MLVVSYPKTAAINAALTHMPFLIWRQYIARGSWSQQVAISSRRGSGCMMMPSLGRSFSSSAPNLKREVSIFAEAPFEESHSSWMRVMYTASAVFTAPRRSSVTSKSIPFFARIITTSAGTCSSCGATKTCRTSRKLVRR